MTHISPYHWRLAALGYLGVVVYLTLLPFQFIDLSLTDAWEAYRRLEFAAPTARGRQQWVANVLMFLPLGFFWTAWWSAQVPTWVGRAAVGLAVAAVAAVTTGSVEFIQSWIPGRAPSLTDMSANFTGGVLGIVLWFALGSRLGALGTWLRSGGPAALRRGLWLYALLYVALSLLPFDFLLSTEELREKLGGDLWGVWSAPAGCEDGLRCAALRLVEGVLSAPIGMLAALYLSAAGLALLLPLALLLGALFELGQLLTYSGVAEGQSVLVRALGILIGGLAVGYADRISFRHFARASRWAVLAAVPPYLVALVYLNLGNNGFALDVAGARDQLVSLRFLPFYYHYYVRESVAIASLIAHLWMYAPVGALVWLWGLRSSGSHRVQAWGAAMVAAVLALLLETGKLFMAGLRPDPTTLLIAPAAAWATFAALALLQRHLHAPFALSPPNSPPLPPGERAGVRGAASPEVHSALLPADSPPLPPGERAGVRGATSSTAPFALSPPRLLGIALLLASLFLAFTWPIAAPWLAAGIAVYAAWLWRQPAAWLLVIPALLPVLNLSLHTGRFLFDELDLFLLATVAVLLLRWRPRGHVPLLPPVIAWALALFAVSLVLSLAVFFWPQGALQPGSWAQYGDGYNAIRAAKGFLWALLLFLLLRQSDLPVRALLYQWFAPGMVIGLLLTLGFVLWERATYPGLLDLDSGYRISGMFTDMHVGGPSIETYLVMAAPFVLLVAWRRQSWLWLAVAFAVLAVALYALIVTYSRAGYAGMGVAVGFVFLGALVGAFRIPGPPRWRLAAVALMPVVVAAVLLPQITGSFFQQRMGQIEDDFGQRLSHWDLALDLRDRGRLGDLIGSGPGSFPGIYRAGNPEGRIPANFAFVGTPGQAALRLGTGDSLFINQRLRLPDADDFRVQVWARADQPARLALFVCEKPVRYSFNCRQGRLSIHDADGPEAAHIWRFQPEGLQTGPWYAQRQLVFSLANASGGSVIEIERLSLISSEGHEVLHNGDFAKGSRHWYFTTDHLWPWRVENQWLEIWLDQGWLGLLAFVVLTLAAFGYWLKGAVRGCFEDACVLASLAGVLTIGVLSTVFWSPRLSLLFYLILLLGVAANHARDRGEPDGATAGPHGAPT